MEDKHVHFGLAIKNARMDCGLTQEALAERAGISCRYLIAIENEYSNASEPPFYRLRATSDFNTLEPPQTQDIVMDP